MTHDLSVVSIYGPTAPSIRVRAYEWLDHLALDTTRYEYAGLGDHSPRTALTHLPAIARAEGRVRSLSRSSLGSTVFLSREASPWSTGGVESRLLRGATRCVYDLDDALFEDRLGWRRVLGKRHKVEMAAGGGRRRDRLTPCSPTSRACTVATVRMIPTCVEPTNYQPKTAYDITSLPTLVWLGSQSTEAYLTRRRTSTPRGAPTHRRPGADHQRCVGHRGMAAVRTHDSFDAWAGVWRKAVLS